MKRARAAALVAALVMSGCAQMTEPLHGRASTEAPTIASTRTAIDEGLALVTALNNVIAENVNTRVWTRAQAEEYGAAADRALEELVRARELLRLGDVAGAKSQAELVKLGLQTLQRQIAAAARK